MGQTSAAMETEELVAVDCNINQVCKTRKQVESIYSKSNRNKMYIRSMLTWFNIVILSLLIIIMTSGHSFTYLQLVCVYE